MEVSRTSMKAARATVAAISHGLDFGFHCVLLPILSAIRLLSRRGIAALHLRIHDVSQHVTDSSYIRCVSEGVSYVRELTLQREGPGMAFPGIDKRLAAKERY